MVVSGSIAVIGLGTNMPLRGLGKTARACPRITVLSAGETALSEASDQPTIWYTLSAIGRHQETTSGKSAPKPSQNGVHLINFHT
jgi:hypothetical protein